MPRRRPWSEGFEAVPLRDLLAALEEAARAGTIGVALADIRTVLEERPDLRALLPADALPALIAGFHAVGACAGRAGTFTPTLTDVLARLVGSELLVGFTYTIASTPGCTVRLETIEVLGGTGTGTRLAADVTPGAATGTVAGAAPIPAGAAALFAVGARVDVVAYFSGHPARWCDRCNPLNFTVCTTITVT
jgi:hypothetical protein